MIKHLLSFLVFLPTLLSAQNRLFLEANLDTVKRKIHFDAMGVNIERMHYRSLDDKGKMPDPILEDMLEAEDLIYRWPGGATANFYHFFEGTSKGYGLLKEEVDAQDHPMRCDIAGTANAACMTFEQYAPTNYIFNLLEYADIYYNKFQKKKKVVWLPNIFTFYINNKTEIHKLRNYKSLEDVIEAHKKGDISDDFFKRVKDVIDVFDILVKHPTIELVGIEYGNEFYFHEPTAGAKYNHVNNALLWLINQNEYKAAVKEHISLYRSIVLFYQSAFEKRAPKIPAAAPVAIITNNGSQANMHLLWNEGIRDSILSEIDGIIHHFYFKRNDGPRIDPITSAEDPGKAGDLLKIKTLADNFIHVRIPQVDEQYEKFFKLTEKGKKMWMTEFNTDNGYFDGYFAEWQNTFFHSYFQFEAFISFIDNVNNSDVMQFAFPHLWVSHINDFNYGAYAAKTEPNGSFKKIKRTTYSTYSILGSLAKKEIKQIDFNFSNSDNWQRHDLFVKSYFEPSKEENSPVIGNLLVVFSNKSGTPLKLHPLEDIQLIVDSTRLLKLSNGYAEYLNAPHIYSSNGLTLLSTNTVDEGEIIHVNKEDNIDVEGDYTIDGYSLGYLSFPIVDLNRLITSVNTPLREKIFDVFPNPSDLIINIKSKDLDFSSPNNRFYVIDVSGRKVDVSMTKIHAQQIQLDIHKLAPGNYHFILENNGIRYTTKFIKK